MGSERHLALKLRYDGAAYHGWQVQKGLPTVCGTLERALRKITGETVRLTGCGRTDAGVHAERYVADLRTRSRIPLDRLPLAVDGHVPPDIAVLEAVEVPEGFDAITWCRKKEYTYRILDSRIRDPFLTGRAWLYPRPLDVELMDRAARAFEGTHDFKAVRNVGTETRTTVRTVHECRVERRGRLVELRVCADGFLYNMARSIAGTVLWAAEGKIRPEEIPEILERGERSAAGPTLPACGLYLTRLWYGDGRLDEWMG